MYINLNWATMGIKVPPTMEELAALAVRHGYEGVDLPGHALSCESAADDARAVMERAGLRCGLFWLPGGFFESDLPTFESEMAQLRELAPRVARAGGRATYQHIWPASDTLTYRENFTRHADRLAQMQDVLWPLGIRIGLEFIGGLDKRRGRKHEFIYTLAQTLELADAVGPGVGLALDVYHWWTSGGTLEDLKRIDDVSRIVNLHLSDGVAGRAIEQQKDLERAMPASTGLVDLQGLLGFLREKGYGGPVICEPFDPNRKRFTTMTSDRVAAEVMSVMGPLIHPAR